MLALLSFRHDIVRLRSLWSWMPENYTAVAHKMIRPSLGGGLGQAQTIAGSDWSPGDIDSWPRLAWNFIFRWPKSKGSYIPNFSSKSMKLLTGDQWGRTDRVVRVASSHLAQATTYQVKSSPPWRVPHTGILENERRECFLFWKEEAHSVRCRLLAHWRRLELYLHGKGLAKASNNAYHTVKSQSCDVTCEGHFELYTWTPSWFFRTWKIKLLQQRADMKKSVMGTYSSMNIKFNLV